MKRSVIQLAGKTSVISLPSKWIQKYNIKKGEELELEERGDELVIKTKQAQKGKKVTLDAKNLHERTLKWVLSGLHKSGYDEIEVLFEKKETLNTIQDTIKNLFMGFAVIDQTSKKCVLKSLSTELDEEFDAVLRRAFLVTNSLASSTLEMIHSGNFKDLEDLHTLEKTNNQLTNFCQRILNKKGFSRLDLFRYVIIWNLEKIADDYKYICSDLSKAKKINPEILVLFKQTNELFLDYYNLFYNFNLKDLNEIAKKKLDLDELLKKSSPKNQDEELLVSHLIGISSKTADFSTSFFALRHEP